MFRSMNRREWGRAALFAWSDLISDRSRKLVGLQSPPPAPNVLVATPILTSRTTTSSTPSPQTPDVVFTPVRGGRSGMSTSGVGFSGEV